MIRIAGTCFRAMLGFALAAYLMYPRECESWLRAHVATVREHSMRPAD